MSFGPDVSSLQKLGKMLIDRRRKDVSKWQGIVKQYVEKVQIENTLTAYDQLGLAVYELHNAKYMLAELKRVHKQLAQLAPTKPHERPSQVVQLPT